MIPRYTSLSPWEIVHTLTITQSFEYTLNIRYGKSQWYLVPSENIQIAYCDNTTYYRIPYAAYDMRHTVCCIR